MSKVCIPSFPGLIPVNCRFQIERYVSALNRLQYVLPCPDIIHVDGRGWSPEVAIMLGDEYLALNVGLSFAIIIDSRQLAAPIVDFRFSAESAALSRYYEKHGHRIEALSLLEPLVLEVATGMRDFSTSSVPLGGVGCIVSVLGGPLLTESDRQSRGAEYLRVSKDGWRNRKLLDALSDSVEQFGDLRGFQYLHIKPEVIKVGAVYTRCTSYTSISELGMETPLIIESYEETRDVMEKLFKHSLIEIPWSSYENQVELLLQKKEALEVQAAWARGFNPGEFHWLDLRRFLSSSSDLGPLRQLEKVLHQVKTETRIQDHDLSIELYSLLAEPRADLSEEVKSAVQRVLAEQNPFDLHRLRASDLHFYYNFLNGMPSWITDWAEQSGYIVLEDACIS